MIEQDQSTGRSTFNGLYVTVRKRYSTALRSTSPTRCRRSRTTRTTSIRPVESRQADEEFGPSLSDRRHVLAVNGVVGVPLGIDLAPVLFLSSGQPLNVTTGRDNNATRFSTTGRPVCGEQRAHVPFRADRSRRPSVIQGRRGDHRRARRDLQRVQSDAACRTASAVSITTAPGRTIPMTSIRTNTVVSCAQTAWSQRG